MSRAVYDLFPEIKLKRKDRKFLVDFMTSKKLSEVLIRLEDIYDEKGEISKQELVFAKTSNDIGCKEIRYSFNVLDERFKALKDLFWTRVVFKKGVFSYYPIACFIF